MKKLLLKLSLLSVIVIGSVVLVTLVINPKNTQASVLTGSNPQISCMAAQNGVFVSQVNVGAPMEWVIIDLSTFNTNAVGTKVSDANIAQAANNSNYYNYLSVSDNFGYSSPYNKSGTISQTYTTTNLQQNSKATFSVNYKEENVVNGAMYTLSTTTCSTTLVQQINFFPIQIVTPTISNVAVNPSTYDPNSGSALHVTYDIKDISSSWTVKGFISDSNLNPVITFDLPSTNGSADAGLSQQNYPGLSKLTDGNYGVTIYAINGSSNISAVGSFIVKSSFIYLIPSLQPSSTTPSTPTNSILSCSASPSSAYVGDSINWQATVSNVSDPSLIGYSWSNAATGSGQTVSKSYSTAGTFTANVTINDPNAGQQTTTCSVTIQAKQTTSTGSGTQPQPQTQPSTQTQTNTGTQNSTNTTSTSSTESQSQNPTLKSAVNLIRCSSNKDKFYLDANGQTYDHLEMLCALGSVGKVSFAIYKSDYNPSNQDNSGSLINMIQNFKITQPGLIQSIWDGHDSYDQVAPAGDYVFVAEAKPDDSYNTDISIQKFSVIAPAAPAETTTSTETSGTAAAVTGTTATSAAQTNTSTTTDLHGAAPESLAGQPSKCDGVNYPTDLPNGRFQTEIIAAYDQCLVSGFGDGTFRAEASLTRAEATKIVLLAAGFSPKEGCYTLDCGSPFKDLDAWQGRWIRAAWDQRMVSGVGPDKFDPNRSITRAEAAALVTKSLQIQPHQGCYTANCGAGFPNNFFLDITQNWEGPYIRALWDLGAAMATGKNTFSPDIPIKRGEFLEMLLAVKK